VIQKFLKNKMAKGKGTPVKEQIVLIFILLLFYYSKATTFDRLLFFKNQPIAKPSGTIASFFITTIPSFTVYSS
jgi:hypothetical protein